MEERQAYGHPPDDDGEGGMLPTAKAATSPSMFTQPIIEVTGLDEVMKKALEKVQEGYKAVMKEAKEGHKTAVRMHGITNTCVHAYYYKLTLHGYDTKMITNFGM